MSHQNNIDLTALADGFRLAAKLINQGSVDGELDGVTVARKCAKWGRRTAQASGLYGIEDIVDALEFKTTRVDKDLEGITRSCEHAADALYSLAVAK